MQRAGNWLVNSIFNIIKILLLLLIAYQLGFLLVYSMLKETFRPKEVIVPDLKGKNIKEALIILKNLNLNVTYKGKKFSSIYPKDTIIWQFPKPNKKVKVGRNIQIVISSGNLTTKTPSLYGLTYNGAISTLFSNKLEVGKVVYAYCPAQTEGTIISQFPKPNTVIPINEKVDLLIATSSPPKKVTVPSLVGLDFETAKNLLEKYNLNIGSIIYQPNDNLPKNTITDQFPKSGVIISEGQQVNLVINARKKEKKVFLKKFSFKIPTGTHQVKVIAVSEEGADIIYSNQKIQGPTKITIPINIEGEVKLLVYVDSVLFINKTLKR